MKQGWEEIKMVDACEILTCGVASTPTYVDEQIGVPFLSAQNVRDGVVVLDKYSFISKEFHQKLTNRNKPSKGDILYSRVGAKYGEAGVVEHNFEFSVYVSVTLIRPKKELLNNYFLKNYLNSPRIKDLAKKSISSSGVPNLNVNSVREFPVPIPSLPEQQRIVAILDEAFAAIAKAKSNAEQNLTNAKELFESYLQGVFENKGEGWKEKTLEQVSKIFGRGKSRHRPRNYEKLYGGIYPFIQTGDIRNCNHYITEYSQTYSELGLAQSKLWPSGTICITIAANIAETGVLTFDACFPDSVIGLVVNEKIADRDFIEYLLQSFKARIQALGKGSAQANINMGTFENELFPFPPVNEQHTIVQKLDALAVETKKLEANYIQKINDLEELKKSVLQKAFSGELKTAKALVY
ncbi:MAG: restriction endonuclease subunit S [Saprospiraceae bacterium]|uniref:Restriction endonuclease subunit S n=1 Tax=Candidatus Defluviibacterium haderslevense TaxID=2981993 RepID=A0A9D7S8E7_9BACT|nr:restriction endonuclease subunit S [Candidatus Defluviibacterium haderslevense]